MLKIESCIYKLRRPAVLCTLLLTLSVPLFSCSLAEHDWQFLCSFSIETGAPILPASEFNALLCRNFVPTDQILWVSEHNVLSDLYALLVPGFFKYFSSITGNIEQYIAVGLPSTLPEGVADRLKWLGGIKISALSPQDDILGINSTLAKQNIYPVIISSDQCTAKVSLFADKNSCYRCYQLVIKQYSRIRLIQTAPGSPQAFQLASNAYVSLIFFDLPLPECIMSGSFYPAADLRFFPASNEELVSSLINADLLKPRSLTEQDPSSYNLPEESE